jgi:hypothetical protein
MRYGLYLPNFDAFGDIATPVDCAREAESAGWDGAFPLRREGILCPDDIRELAAFSQSERQKAGIAHRPFDIVHLNSPTPGDNPAAAAALVAPYIEAGATWWLERISPDEFGAGWQEKWPLQAMRHRIQQGPPRPATRTQQE